MALLDAVAVARFAIAVMVSSLNPTFVWTAFAEPYWAAADVFCNSRQLLYASEKKVLKLGELFTSGATRFLHFLQSSWNSPVE